MIPRRPIVRRNALLKASMKEFIEKAVKIGSSEEIMGGLRFRQLTK